MISLFNSVAPTPALTTELSAAIGRVMASGQYLLGKITEEFEQAFSAYCGVNYSVGVNSGTSALHLALLVAGIGEGDEVITTPFTFLATGGAINYVGAKPVFVDIEEGSFNIDPSKISQAITPKTKAIIPVHLFGQMADMDPIMAIAKEHNLIVIEDTAQACGAIYKDKHAGSIGDLGCFSFYPTKNMGALGDAGMVTTKHAHYAEELQSLRNWGKNATGEYFKQAYNYRIAEVQAAILLCKLKYLNSWNQRRADFAAGYIAAMQDSTLQMPIPMPYTDKHVYSLFTLRSAQRAELLQALKQSDIQTALYYPKPLHLQPVYSYLGHKAGDFPQAELAAKTVLSLPVYPELSSADHDFIKQSLQKSYQSLKQVI